jgi:hypothetical protein
LHLSVGQKSQTPASICFRRLGNSYNVTNPSFLSCKWGQHPVAAVAVIQEYKSTQAECQTDVQRQCTCSDPHKKHSTRNGHLVGDYKTLLFLLLEFFKRS